MLMMLTWQRIVRNNTLLGVAPVHMVYEKEKATEIDLHFHNGLMITLMKLSSRLENRVIEGMAS